MGENKTSKSIPTLKIGVVIVLIVVLWPILEVIVDMVAAIITFAVGVGLASILFIAIVYPHSLTDKGDETGEFGNVKRNIHDKSTKAYNNLKKYFKDRGD